MWGTQVTLCSTDSQRNTLLRTLFYEYKTDIWYYIQWQDKLKTNGMNELLITVCPINPITSPNPVSGH
jgi:hypothetical protein